LIELEKAMANTPVKFLPTLPQLPAREENSAFRALVSGAEWKRLPVAIQRRFERHLAVGESVTYVGKVASTERTALGWIWAQLLRVIGAPLPLAALSHSPSVVVVTGDRDVRAQVWTRIYHEAGRLPQVVRSMKHFAGSTGLEERVGGGIGMALTVSVESRALLFRSAGFHWRCGRLRLAIPIWLTPGQVEVRHREERHGCFSFELSVVHPWFGRIIHQVAYFQDAT
jgi:Domain of unknown function (DUF4166)